MAARQRVISVFLAQGLAGLMLMLWLTWIRQDQVTDVFQRLGPNAWIVIAVFIAFAITLALLKFGLTDKIYVSLVMTAFMAFFPLLGGVLTAWIAVVVSIGTRILGMRQIGPTKISVDDPITEWVRTFGLFGTYGIPVIAAATLYEYLGGEVPALHATPPAAARIALCGLVMIAVNNLIMFRAARAYGYSLAKIVKIDLVDSSIYVLTIPYAVVTAMSYAAIGWGAVVALAFTGGVANFIARNLAVTRTRSRQQLQRLASLTQIGKTISLRFTTEELLMAIYTECRKVIDCSLFSIALYDDHRDELAFELDIRDEQVLPKERMPLGEGLNSWVVKHHQPLLLGSTADDRKLGLRSVPDTKASESWLGVPMMTRDRVIGVISVESYRKHAFTSDDVFLLTAIANQAAVAIENAQLYKDLEGLTYALEQRVLERTNE